jgi:predicted nucleotidyltransferase
MKQREVLIKTVPKLRSDSANTGVLLIGSVATEKEQPSSDLDLLILGDKNWKDTEFVDGILIEYFYVTYDEAVARLNSSGREVYNYLESKIMFDLDGRLVKLMQMADKKYRGYQSTEKEKMELINLLHDIKVKLSASFHDNDQLKADFLTAAYSWRLIEAVYAVNDKPVPPPCSLIRELPKLKLTPGQKWFSRLYSGDTRERTLTLIDGIDWVLLKL